MPLSRRYIPFVFIAAIYLILAVLVASRYDITRMPDTASYVEAAHIPVTDAALYEHWRFATFVLLIKILGENPELIAWFQLIVSSAVWLLFASVFSATLEHRRLRIIAFALILFLSLGVDFFMWNRIILTESLDNTLILLFITLSIAFQRRVQGIWTYGKTWQWGAVFAVLIVLWGFSRPPNYFNAVILIPFVLAIAIMWHRLARPWTVTFAVILLTLAGVYVLRNYLVTKADVWQNAFMNNLAANILPDDDKRTFFAERGMPVDEAAMHFSGYIPANHGGDWNAVFGDWIDTRGMSVYIEFLVKTAPARVEEALGKREDVINPDALMQVYGREQDSLEQPLPAWENANAGLLYNPGGVTFEIIGSLTLLLFLMMVAAQQEWDSRWLIPAVVILSTLPVALLNLNADAYEPRHHIANSLKLRFGVVMLALYCFDWMLLHKNRVLPAQWLLAGLIVLTGVVELLGGYLPTRDHIVYPVVSALSDTNRLATWDVDDLSYRLYQHIDLDATVMKIQTDVINGEVYTRDFVVNWNHHGTYPELMERDGKIGLAWRNTPQPIDVAGPLGAVYGPYFVDDTIGNTYRVWRDTRLPGYLLDLGIDYVYVDALSWQYLPAFQRGVLQAQYPEVARLNEPGIQGQGILLHVVSDQRTFAQNATSIDTLGLAPLTYDFYERDKSGFIESDAVIFNPSTGVSRTDLILDMGGLINTIESAFDESDENAVQPQPFFDVLDAFSQMQFEADLQLSPDQSAILNEWRNTKSAALLRELNIDYIFFPDDWFGWLSAEEQALFDAGQGYEMVRGWQGIAPVDYRLYRITAIAPN